ncbi:hypothetical protein B9G98_02177 [Wickerhamiella sorbophila]|uniref:Uncharacterized protein n=1 Tax=Wickerhamiella sorbophila TaxID=45607 RepID=A0A2T0FHX0_9ASCO|nr:hypothetical protein B9G98_02177 [Wickerhamiella sorbophila]PRT54557.1 hypothetical protein B9G98_02177 [Wickerhamiella sorbophila]
MALSNIPQAVAPGDTFSFSLHLRHSCSGSVLGFVRVEIIGTEHTIAGNWGDSNPSSRIFTLLSTEIPLNCLNSGKEEIIPLALQFPCAIQAPNGHIHCVIPPTVGSYQQVCRPVKGICVQYFLKVSAPGSSAATQKELVALPKETGFDIKRFVDISGAPLYRQYSLKKQLRGSLLCSSNKNELLLSGGVLFGAEGEANFNLSFAHPNHPSFSISYALYQVHYSTLSKMGQILDETKNIQMRRIKIFSKDVPDFTWTEKLRVLTVPYTIADAEPNFVSEITALSYFFEIRIKFRWGLAKLAVPLVLGNEPSSPPAYHV